MGTAKYNPKIHHRQSIRLKGHDYAGGGIYFITICAHREFIQFAKENPFGVGARATQVSPVRGLIEERIRVTAEKCPFMRWEEAVIMPDHFHALIRMQGGHARLGDVIGGFKAAVSRKIRRGDTCVALSLPPDIRIWHRNYYDRIIRSESALVVVRNYIRMNPWKLILEGTHEGCPYRAIGNPALLHRRKIGMLCSRDCPERVLDEALARVRTLKEEDCVISGFHSPPEMSLLEALLQSEAKVICCPAWGIDEMKIPAAWLPALEQNRMLILEMRNGKGDLAAARERNAFIMKAADELWMPHVTRGGMLENLAEELKQRTG